MRIINLTPHSIEVYASNQFVGLENTSPTTWIADSVKGDPLAQYPSEGVARISVSIEALQSHLPGEVVRTTYGEAVGIPQQLADNTNTILIVSLPMKSMAMASGHPLAKRMVSPYKVVRGKQEGSPVLGCMGFTY